MFLLKEVIGMSMSDLLLPDLFSLLDALDWGVSIFDEKGKFLWVNRYVTKCSGRPRRFYEGKSVMDFKNLHILDEPICTKVFKEKKKITGLQRSKKENGKLVDYVVTATPIFNSYGKIKFVVADRIEVSRVEDKLNFAKHAKKEDEVSFVKRHNRKFELIYKSKIMECLIKKIEQAASVASVILLQGESGTGKEVFAHYIHDHSPVKLGPMIEINCASIAESILESELFGYTKGAFTGASSKGKMGLIEAANHGTLFLDEINSMPLDLQAKLLRVLENKSITRLGSTCPVDVDFRLVSATNKDLWQCVLNKTFREDLFYRLNVIPVTIPPLRERKEDIPALIDFFLNKFCDRYSMDKRFSKSVYQTLISYDWPGNVRELKNVIERMIIMSTAETITLHEVPRGLFQEEVFGKKLTKDNEKLQIIQALEANGGHREKTAQYLGISRRTLQYKLKKFNLLGKQK